MMLDWLNSIALVVGYLTMIFSVLLAIVLTLDSLKRIRRRNSYRRSLPSVQQIMADALEQADDDNPSVDTE